MVHSNTCAVKVECLGSPTRRDEPIHGQAYLLTKSECTSPLSHLSPTPSRQALELEHGSDTLEVVRDDQYYLDMVEFEVENIVYKAPRVHWPFVKTHSSWTTQIRTSDVLFFFRFIDICIESNVDVPLLSKVHWMRMLQLATAWSLDNLREFTTAHLSPWIGSDVEKLAIGREFKIPAYLHMAFENLAYRPAPLTPHEVEVIGLTSSARLVEIREQIHRQRSRLSDDLRLDWFQRTLHPIILEEPSGTPIRTCDNDVIAEVQCAKRAGVKDWLYEGFRKLVIRPEGLTTAEIATLELTQDCVRSLTYAHEIYWRIVVGDGGGGLDRDLVRLVLDRAVAQSFPRGSELAPNTERDLATRIVLASQYRSPEWLREIYTQLLTRDSAITVDEARALGRDAFAALARGRASFWLSNKAPIFLRCQNARDLAYEPSIRSLVHNDLDVHLNLNHENAGSDEELIAISANGLLGPRAQ